MSLETVWLIYSSDGKFVEASTYPIEEQHRTLKTFPHHFHVCKDGHAHGPGCKFYDWTIIKIVADSIVNEWRPNDPVDY